MLPLITVLAQSEMALDREGSDGASYIYLFYFIGVIFLVVSLISAIKSGSSERRNRKKAEDILQQVGEKNYLGELSSLKELQEVFPLMNT